MKKISKNISSELIVKKSKFIANISYIENESDAKDFISRIRKEYSDARHNVPVYIIGEKQEVRHANDDGEPGGTAGMPVLTFLLAKEITNIVVVVTRYFGGIKLGPGGLVRAYTKVVREAVSKAGLDDYVVMEEKSAEFAYDEYDDFKRKLKQDRGEIISEDFGEKVKVRYRLPARGREKNAF
jgi:uncharacterized YigZ family protein